eukprot:TRINITY_DN1504_c0_g1_i1.p1 TRINITY_DN1504_c0_g1~~TRINITY_DN1504_c0_g1_i1.p1  ORF type:complete len:525 (+),score=85.20 TRINITY_DN1504_c0_g1_i1:40-1575(+)
MASGLAVVTREEVAKHNTPDSAWIIIDSIVYDVTDFSAMHPGGEQLLLEYAGKDATEAFYGLHRHEDLIKFGLKIKVGQIAGEKPQVINDPAGFSPVPYAEHPSLRGFKSPYYTDKHKQYRAVVRKFISENVLPDARACEESGNQPSKELVKKLAAEGFMNARLGPGKHLSGLKLPGGVDPSEFNYFYELITQEEFARLGCRGYVDGLGGGMVIGLPPVFNFGSAEIQKRVVPQVLGGDKYICLAISEAFTGSDVASIKTRAKKSPCGKFFIVNGTKKWITGGMYADFFSTAVRTDAGISMLLIERSPGVRTKPIKTSYSPTAGTAYVIFEDVKVPVENLLGKEGQGFPVIMSNFNHERWAMCVSVNVASRLVIEECFKWAKQRKVFDKELIEQPVIRQKLAGMVSMHEANTQQLDFITYQMNQMSYKEQAIHLAGPLALLKYGLTRTASKIADEAVQIFGGRGITKTGMGKIIESFNRTYKFDSVLGGSEEILADLGIRQALKNFPNAKL